MNAGVYKLPNLGTSLTIGLGVGWFARRGHDREIPRAPVVAAPSQETRVMPEIVAEPELPLIFQGLSSADAGVREATQATLEFLLDEEFDDPAVAAAWWQRNRHRFDQNRIRVE